VVSDHHACSIDIGCCCCCCCCLCKDDYLSGVSVFDEVELESSKSSLIFEIIEEEKTPAEASVQSLLSYFRGTTHGYNRYLMNE